MMKQINPVIFGGPDYCENGHEKCDNLDKVEWRCKYFAKTKTLEIDIILRWFRKCQECKERGIKKTGLQFTKVLMMPKRDALFLAELEIGIVRLRKLRSDLSIALIQEKILEGVNEIYQSHENVNAFEILKTVSEAFYNKACAGEPMSWESKQTIHS